MNLPRLTLGLFLTLSIFAPFVRAETAPNTLTPEEAAAGWRLLWDGRTGAGWRGLRHDGFPPYGWRMEDGVLTVVAAKDQEGRRGGDIVTQEEFAAFELQLDFKLTPGANSGIKYYVAVPPAGRPGSGVGLEFQLLDDERHPDAKLGRDGNRTTGSLYDLIPAAKDKPLKPVGEWNTARIVSDGRKVEHWLNGRLVVSFDRTSPEFARLVRESKFKDRPGFGQLPASPILLQDHGDEVHFRNLKIRRRD